MSLQKVSELGSKELEIGSNEQHNKWCSSAQRRLRDLKSKISSQSKKNFVLEKDVRYLDSRIALLIQNRMALEESEARAPIPPQARLTAPARGGREPSRRQHRNTGGRLPER